MLKKALLFIALGLDLGARAAPPYSAGDLSPSPPPAAVRPEPRRTGKFYKPRQYVNSILDFELHMASHIKRVEALGAALIRMFPDHFEGVDESLLREYLSLHDQSKVNRSKTFLKRHGLRTRHATILEDLYAGYGRNFAALSEAEKTTWKRLVDELNTIDREVSRDFFRRHEMLESDGRPGPKAQLYVLAEKIADTVDRGMSPVSAEEFNKPMTPASAFTKDPLEQRMALALERRYSRIVGPLAYTEYRRRYFLSPCSLDHVVDRLVWN